MKNISSRIKEPKIKNNDLIEIYKEHEPEHYKEIRERWDKEDDLLNNRTGMFLTVNAILCAALLIQTKDSSLFNFAISIIGAILSLLWLTVSKRSWHCINFLSKISEGISPNYSKGLHMYRRPRFLPPTVAIALILPLMVLVCWIIFAALNL